MLILALKKISPDSTVHRLKTYFLFFFQYNMPSGKRPELPSVDMEYHVESSSGVNDVGHRDGPWGTPAVLHGASCQALWRRGGGTGHQRRLEDWKVYHKYFF